jgi:hypothetical protein
LTLCNKVGKRLRRDCLDRSKAGKLIERVFNDGYLFVKYQGALRFGHSNINDNIHKSEFMF